MAEIYSTFPDMLAIVSDDKRYLEIRGDHGEEFALHTQNAKGEEVIITSEQLAQEYAKIMEDFDPSAFKRCGIDAPVNIDPNLQKNVDEKIEVLQQQAERDAKEIFKDHDQALAVADIGYETVLKENDPLLVDMSGAALNIIDGPVQRDNITCGRE